MDEHVKENLDLVINELKSIVSKDEFWWEIERQIKARDLKKRNLKDNHDE